MEGKLYTFKVQETLIDIYKDLKGYTASIYGQLPLPFEESEDEIKQFTLVDLIILITLKYCKTGFKLEIFDIEEKTWSDF